MEAPDYPVRRSLAGLLLDVLLALAQTIEPGFFHRLAASALNVSNSDVRVFLRSWPKRFTDRSPMKNASGGL